MHSYLSLGGGVQSSALALMAAHGEIAPLPEAAIFADTQAESQSVYHWLDWLERKLPFPVQRVTAGPLAAEALSVRTSRHGNIYQGVSVPAFIVHEGAVGVLRRQCTLDYKVIPIQRKLRELREPWQPVELWLGISWDEVYRMKPSRLKWITHRWPLIERRLTRGHCLEWMRKHGYPEPPRSACVFCPYHDDAEWQRLKETEPEEFRKAVRFENDLQGVLDTVSGLQGSPYLHRSCRPLADVEFNDDPQIDLFSSECEGLCGV